MIKRADGGYLGGVLRITETMSDNGVNPCWMPYLYVEDVDAEVAAIEAEGGTAAAADHGDPCRAALRWSAIPQERSDLPYDPHASRGSCRARPAMCSIR